MTPLHIQVKVMQDWARRVSLVIAAEGAQIAKFMSCQRTFFAMWHSALRSPNRVRASIILEIVGLANTMRIFLRCWFSHVAEKKKLRDEMILIRSVCQWRVRIVDQKKAKSWIKKAVRYWLDQSVREKLIWWRKYAKQQTQVQMATSRAARRLRSEMTSKWRICCNERKTFRRKTTAMITRMFNKMLCKSLATWQV